MIQIVLNFYTVVVELLDLYYYFAVCLIYNALESRTGKRHGYLYARLNLSALISCINILIVCSRLIQHGAKCPRIVTQVQTFTLMTQQVYTVHHQLRRAQHFRASSVHESTAQDNETTKLFISDTLTHTHERKARV